MVTQGLCCLPVPVCGQVVENDDRSGGDLGDKHFTDVGGKRRAVLCTFYDPRRDQCVLGQARDKRLRAPTPEGRIQCQPLTDSGPTAQAGQVGLQSRFINKQNAIRQGANGRLPMFEPISPLLPYLGTTALGGNRRLFLLSVIK